MAAPTSAGPEVVGGQQPFSRPEPGVLQPETTYYWRIDMVTLGMPTTGDVWEFETSETFPTL